MADKLNMESILTSMKKMLGGVMGEQVDVFDTDLIIHINSIFMILHQLGVGPAKPFTVKDESTTWDEFISDRDDIESVKTYMYLKLKLIFDPPTTSFVLTSYENQIKELEWRLNVQVENHPNGGAESV